MVKSLRLKEMEEYIIDKGVASMDELCKRYDISMNTLRNDIAELTEHGKVKKVYGGVCSTVQSSGSSLVSIDVRKSQNMQCKTDIARAAAQFIEPGDIIFVDSGTTCENIIDFLGDKGHLTVVSHSLEVANKAATLPDVELFCLGGRLQRSTSCFIGMGSAGMLEHYNIGKAFMGTKGITLDGSITDSSMGEFDIKKWAVTKAAQVYLLADSNKFGRTGLMSYASLDKVNMLITDHAADEKLITLCENMKTDIKLI